MGKEITYFIKHGDRFDTLAMYENGKMFLFNKMTGLFDEEPLFMDILEYGSENNVDFDEVSEAEAKAFIEAAAKRS